MAQPLRRKVRFQANRRLLVVRSMVPGQMGHLSTIGTGPWVNVKVVPSRKRALVPAPALKTGRKIIRAENQRRTAAGQKPIDISDWGKNKKMRAVAIAATPQSVRITVEPRNFSEYLISQEESKRIDPKTFRGMIRGHNRGGQNLLRRNVQMLASGAFVVIGDKYLVLPKRAEKARLYPDSYHLFAGYGEAPKTQFRREKLPQPHQTTRREIREEIGIGKLEFLGPDLKKARGKNPPALAAIQNLESRMPYPDVFYLMRVPTKRPDLYLAEHFEKTPDGRIVPKKGIDSWEMADGIVIPFSSRAVGEFIAHNSGKITPMAIAGLKALEQTLKDNKR